MRRTVPRGLPLVGHAPWFHADTSGLLLSLSRSQGDVARFRLGRDDAFLLSHPDHVQRVLVHDAALFRKGHLIRRARRLLGEGLITSEGALHHAQRRRVQPAFARRHLERYGESVPPIAAALAERWRAGERIDVGAAMDELTMGIIAHALFGAADALGEADDLRRLARWFPVLALPGAERLERMGVPPFSMAGAAAQRIDASIRRRIEAAHASGAGDLLSLLAGAGDDPMPPQLVRDEAMTLFLAGHDTTAAALTWTWYLIATHPAVEHAMHEELRCVLGERDPMPSDVPALPFTIALFDEVLRLYPAVGRIGRRPVADYEIDGTAIPAGAAVFVSPWVTQRDERWWPAAEVFDPWRWLTPAERPRFAWFPFGAGPRSCVGGQMARMSAVLAIATIARRWRFIADAGRSLRVRSLLTLKPRGGMRLQVAPR